MLILTEEQLAEVLTCFEGKLIEENQITAYQRFSLPFFSDLEQVPDPRIQMTQQLNITPIYSNYVSNYNKTPGATFTAFIKWMMIQSMQGTHFNWRYINSQWYEFNNLPLEVAVTTTDNRQQLVYYLKDVVKSSWSQFCEMHSALRRGEEPDDSESLNRIPYYAFSHQIVGLHFERMTSCSTTRIKICDHQPWIVFSSRYTEGECIFLPLHFVVSHASLTPRLIEQFIDKFKKRALEVLNPSSSLKENFGYLNVEDKAANAERFEADQIHL